MFRKIVMAVLAAVLITLVTLQPGARVQAQQPPPSAPASPASRTYTATTAAGRTATLTVTGTTLSVSVSPAVAGVFSLRLTNRTTRLVQTYESQSTATGVPAGSYDVEASVASVFGRLARRDSATFTNVQVPPAAP